MKIPVPVGILNYQGEKKKLKCTRAVYDYYHNYYFGKNVNFLDSVQDTNIFRGTYQNLSTLSGQTTTQQTQEQSI